MARSDSDKKSGNRFRFMGRFFRLFDFNGCIAARKLITNKKFAGRFGSRSSRAASNSSIDDEIPVSVRERQKRKASTMLLYSRGHYFGAETPSLRGYTKDQQYRGFKEEGQQSRSPANKKSFMSIDDIDTQKGTNELQKYPDLSLVTLPSPEMSSSMSDTKRWFHKSKELLNAMESLRSNKEFFRSFLQGREIRGDGSVQHGQSHRAPDEQLRARRRQEPVLTDTFKPLKPTRIVVLKPNPAPSRVNDTKSLGRICSSKDGKRDSIHTDNGGVLERLREQLNRHHVDKHGNGARTVQPFSGELWRQKFQYSKEVARKVIRQVSEAVGRESLAHASYDQQSGGEVNGGSDFREIYGKSRESRELEAQGVEEDLEFTCSSCKELLALVSAHGVPEWEMGADQDCHASVDLQVVDKVQEDSVISPQATSYSRESEFVGPTMDLKPEQLSLVNVLDVLDQEGLGNCDYAYGNLQVDNDKVELELELCARDEDCDCIGNTSAFEEQIHTFEMAADCKLSPFLHDVDLNDFCCPSGREMEILYVRDVLIACRLGRMETLNSLHEIYSKIPLDTGVCKELESNCCSMEKQSMDEKHCYRICLPSSMQHLLFDCVNEIVCEAARVSQQSHFLISTASIPLCGRKLFEYVWSKVCCLTCVQFDGQINLDNLVLADLCEETESRWAHHILERGSIADSIESTIFDDLMEETLLILI